MSRRSEGNTWRDQSGMETWKMIFRCGGTWGAGPSVGGRHRKLWLRVPLGSCDERGEEETTKRDGLGGRVGCSVGVGLGFGHLLCIFQSSFLSPQTSECWLFHRLGGATVVLIIVKMRPLNKSRGLWKSQS